MVPSLGIIQSQFLGTVERRRRGGGCIEVYVSQTEELHLLRHAEAHTPIEVSVCSGSVCVFVRLCVFVCASFHKLLSRRVSQLCRGAASAVHQLFVWKC